MNAPVHFKDQLADELNARATSLSAPAGHRTLLRFRAPRRGLALTVGVAAAAAAVAVAVPLVSGSDSAQQAASTPRSTPGTHGTPNARSTPSTGLNIVNADYAVRSKPGGTVSVQLFNVKGVPGLQAALDKAGIPAKVLVPTASCHTTGHTDSTPHGSLLKVMPRSGFHNNGVRDIKPSAIQPGDHLLFIAEGESGSPGILGIRLVHRAPSCIPAD